MEKLLTFTTGQRWVIYNLYLLSIGEIENPLYAEFTFLDPQAWTAFCGWDKKFMSLDITTQVGYTLSAMRKACWFSPYADWVFSHPSIKAEFLILDRSGFETDVLEEAHTIIHKRTKVVRDAETLRNILIFAGRRFGKSQFLYILSAIRSYLPIFSKGAGYHLIQPAEQKANQFLRQNFIPFLKEHGFDKNFKINLADMTLTSKYNEHIISFSHTDATAGGRGIEVEIAGLDEADFQKGNSSLRDVIDAYTPTLLKSQGIFMVVTSPDEKKATDPYLTEKSYDTQKWISFFLPTLGNTSRLDTGKFYMSANGVTQLMSQSSSPEVNTQIYMGYPIPSLGSNLWSQEYFYTKVTEDVLGQGPLAIDEYSRSLTTQDDPEAIHKSLEFKRIINQASFTYRDVPGEGKYAETNLDYTIVSVDPASSLEGDYTVATHLGVKESTGDIYVLGMLRFKETSTKVMNKVSKFVFDILDDQRDYKLRFFYYEVKDEDNLAIISSLKNELRNCFSEKYKNKQTGLVPPIPLRVFEEKCSSLTVAITRPYKGSVETVQRAIDKDELDLSKPPIRGSKLSRSIQALSSLESRREIKNSESSTSTSFKKPYIIWYPITYSNDRDNLYKITSHKLKVIQEEFINFNLRRVINNKQHDTHRGHDDIVDSISTGIIAISYNTRYKMEKGLDINSFTNFSSKENPMLGDAKVIEVQGNKVVENQEELKYNFGYNLDVYNKLMKEIIN